MSIFASFFRLVLFESAIDHLSSLPPLFPGFLLLLADMFRFVQREVPKEITGTTVAILLFLNSISCNIGPWFVAWRDTGMDTVRGPMFVIVSGVLTL